MGPPGGYPPFHSNQPPGGPHAEPSVLVLSLSVVQDRKTPRPQDPLGARTNLHLKMVVSAGPLGPQAPKDRPEQATDDSTLKPSRIGRRLRRAPHPPRLRPEYRASKGVAPPERGHLGGKREKGNDPPDPLVLLESETLQAGRRAQDSDSEDPYRPGGEEKNFVATCPGTPIRPSGPSFASQSAGR